MMIKRFISITFLLFLASAANADFSGVVVGVLDGDTVDVLVNNRPVRVRLAEIDAPEKAQPYGTKSRQTLADAVFQKNVFVQSSSIDRYGRSIGTLTIDQKSINKMMVSRGMAWAYTKYLKDKSFLSIEAHAREQKIGLWADPHATAPWEWRASKRRH